MRKSLKSKMVLTVSLITLTVLLLTSAVTLFFSVSMTDAANEDSLRESAALGQQQVNAWFGGKEELLSFIASDLSWMFELGQKDEIEAYFEQFGLKYDYLVDAYIGTPDGQMYSGSHWVPTEGYVVTDRDWYRAAKGAQGGVAYTAPYIDAYSKSLVVTISSTAVDRKGQDLGVLALDIKVASLADFISKSRIMHTTGRAFLLDNAGNIVSHENDAFMPDITAAGEEKIYNIADAGISLKSEKMVDGISLGKGRDWDGRNKFIATAVIPGSNWTYGFSVPTSDFNASYVTLGIKWAATVLVMVLVSVLLSIVVMGKLLEPIQAILAAAGRLAMGDVNVELQIRTGDELENLSNQFEQLRASTQEQITAMHSLAQGDFTVSVDPKSDKDVLSVAINQLVRQLRELVENVTSSVGQITIGSRQMADGTQYLAQGSTEQGAAIETLSSSVNSILRDVKQSAAIAQDASRSIFAASERAQAGNQAMQDMMQAMAQIETASAAIGTVIKTIDEIALQTNLLALNASVEAAHAGVHGRGFAVVAEQVRTLAARSAEATRETTTLIESTTSRISEGVTIAGNTQDILEEIVGGIVSAADLVGNIDKMTEDQAREIAAINDSLAQISQVVTQNSASAQESAASSQEMSAQATTLSDAVSVFRV